MVPDLRRHASKARTDRLTVRSRGKVLRKTRKYAGQNPSELRRVEEQIRREPVFGGLQSLKRKNTSARAKCGEADDSQAAGHTGIKSHAPHKTYTDTRREGLALRWT